MGYSQQYGATGSVFFNSITGWHLKSTTPTSSIENTHVVRDSGGHYLPDSKKSSGAKTTITEVWECNGDSTAAPSVKIGKISALVAVDSASLACTGSGRPTLTITGHRHDEKQDNACTHLDGAYECQFEMPPNAYGAVNPFGSAVSGFEDLEDYEITASTQTFAIGHTDENGKTGKFLVGASRGVTLTAHLEATTANTVEVGDSGDWVINSASRPTTNEGLVKLTVDGIKYIDETASGS